MGECSYEAAKFCRIVSSVSSVSSWKLKIFLSIYVACLRFAAKGNINAVN
jgi:hypothetical protein